MPVYRPGGTFRTIGFALCLMLLSACASVELPVGELPNHSTVAQAIPSTEPAERQELGDVVTVGMESR